MAELDVRERNRIEPDGFEFMACEDALDPEACIPIPLEMPPRSVSVGESGRGNGRDGWVYKGEKDPDRYNDGG